MASKVSQWRWLTAGAGLFIFQGASHGATLPQLAPISSISILIDAPQAFEVTVRFTGLENEALEDTLRPFSMLATNPKSFSSFAPLRRTAAREAETLSQFLQSRGYFDAAIIPRVRRQGRSVTVDYRVRLGALYEIDTYQIRYQTPLIEGRPATFGDASIPLPDHPTGETLAALESQLLKHLWDTGFPSAEPLGRYVKADPGSSTAQAFFPIRTGPRAEFGAIRVSGEEHTNPKYIEAIGKIPTGTVYSRSRVDAFRDDLGGTGLFREISIQPGPTADDGTTDIRVELEERKRRTVGFGLSFATDLGPGAEATWENRNLYGNGEVLRASLSYTAPRQEGELIFEKPVPRWPGSWQLSALVENEDTDAFEAQSATLGGSLRQLFFDDTLTLSAGLSYNYAQITDGDGTEDSFSTASFPLAALFNNEDDRLNPTTGHRASLLVTPFAGTTSFAQVELGGATRIGFGQEKQTILAIRTLFGASFGASRIDIPATERFYAGGGGSIRGYGFQEAGPIGSTGDPLGGSSIAEVNIEGRQQITKKIQLAVFADGGAAYISETPDFSGDFLIGAGAGVRYATPIGPIRLDVALPLKRRTEHRFNQETGTEEITFEDDAVHLYIALGQPF
ncbi:MAG: BamA/TamA family outer membrane protein [Pseudomonadota bacterium]